MRELLARTKWAGTAVAVLPLTLAASACSLSFDSFGDAGPTVTESFDIEEFTELKVGSAFEVELTVGEEASLEVDISEDLLDDLEIEQSSDRLSIGLTGRGTFGYHVLKAKITTQDLKALDLEGAVRVDLGEVDLDELDVELEGAVQLEASGSVDDLSVRAQGASQVDFAGVVVERAEVSAEGASDISLDQAAEVTGRLEGASRLSVADDAVVDVDTSGASQID